MATEFLRRNTDQYVCLGPALDKTAGLGNEDGLTVTSWSGVAVKSTYASATTHTTFTPDATASNDWGMANVGHGGALQLKIPDSEIDYLGGLDVYVWYDAESLPVWKSFQIIPADLWDAWFGTANQKVDTVKISGDSDAADNCELMFDGTGYAGGTTKLGVDVVKVSGDSDAADNLELAYDGTGYAGGTEKQQVDVVKWEGHAVHGHTVEGLPVVQLHSAGTDGGISAPTNFEDLSVTDTTGLVAVPATQDVNAKTITAGAIANASFNADVGSTAYASNIIALAVRKVLDELKLDHLLAVAESDDAVDNSIIAKLAATGGDWSTFVGSTDSLQAIRDRGDAAWITATGFAVAGDKMDLIDAPNGTAVTAIQSGLSTHNADDVKTALEADGSKLDHLWEMTEDDGGVRRLTANALEEVAAGSADVTAIVAAITAAHATTDSLINTIDDSVDSHIRVLSYYAKAAQVNNQGGSAVADLIDELQGRIPDERSGLIFPALNKAISLITKRLYLLESDLVVGELDVSIFAQQTYTASTIGFVNGVNLDVADTITDSAYQFITELFVADMPITTNCSGNEGPFRIYSVAAGTLTLNTSNGLTTQAAGSSYTITSANDFGYLPDDFWGFIDKPYISGYKYPLEPNPSQEMQLSYTSASGVNTGTPTYYKLQGNKLRILPATGTDITIKGDYFKKQVKLTSMEEIVPFNGVLDDVISEYLARVLIGGTPVADSELQNFLTLAVDLVAEKRGRKGAKKLPAGVPWGSL